MAAWCPKSPRAHAERLAPMIEATLADAGMSLADVDAIAATAGRG
jgi:N6-L-threonylcarbamoyladenine synthase